MTLNRALITLGLLALTTLGVLALGNPQWDKHIFMFQAFIWPNHSQNVHQSGSGPISNYYQGHNSEVPLPDNYSGAWTSWDRNGRIVAIQNFEDGNFSGIQKDWIYSKMKTTVYRIVSKVEDGMLVGTSTHFRDNKLVCITHYIDNYKSEIIYRKDLDYCSIVPIEIPESANNEPPALIDRRVEFGIEVE